LFLLWLFFNDAGKILSSIHNQAEMVAFNSKEGFLILGLFAPLAHLVGIVEHFRPELIRKHARSINYSAIAFFAFLFVFAIGASNWFERKVQNAGYISCRELNHSGTFSIYLVYTRNQQICDQMTVAEKADNNTE
jgi:hypothetical protein